MSLPTNYSYETICNTLLLHFAARSHQSPSNSRKPANFTPREAVASQSTVHHNSTPPAEAAEKSHSPAQDIHSHSSQAAEATTQLQAPQEQAATAAHNTNHLHESTTIREYNIVGKLGILRR